MLGYEKEQRSLTRNQKEAIGLLSIGTFLEYFDLMLYVHMAVLLNELFYPKADAHASALYAAAAFCSTYLLRPFGALIFGWIGDNIGRKSTVVITTAIMSISCIAMATLPTYAQIGVTAAWVVTVCRIVQGISSMGEVIGAELYITEITKPPIQYPAVAIVTIFSSIGGFAALGIADLAINGSFNWRIAFVIGAVIAIIGAIARTHLRETPEFVDAKRQLKKSLELASQKININTEKLEDNLAWKEKVKQKNSLALFFIQCAWPICFYITYFHCGNILKTNFNFTSEEVIHQNFIVSIFQVLGFAIWTYLSCYVYPLTLLKYKVVIFTCITLIFPYALNIITSSSALLIIQILLVIFSLSYSSAMPIFYKHFPVFKRFTYASFIYALSRAFIYIITSFGLIYLTKYFGNWGILIVTIPVVIGFIWGIFHFEKLEKETGNYSIKTLYNLGFQKIQ
ncbi:Putative sialic acid transporter [Rickettsia tillamookensis]|uniref:Sialic acid transporter n=1 Tax=Rickettsia tillamookensis TaxID=2761623 RepID=A0A9E6SQ76_9RICK|nr:MFS transporter [Rickettsia tillamookensis]QQV74844.1 Putative sialic acid transporter [Rickettsia tillamookensis]